MNLLSLLIALYDKRQWFASSKIVELYTYEQKICTNGHGWSKYSTVKKDPNFSGNYCHQLT